MKMAKILEEFRPHRLLPILVAGTVVAVVYISIVTAFAMLIYSGELTEYLPVGLGFMLLGQLVAALAMALFSSLRVTLPIVQDNPVAILALVSVAIMAGMPDSSTQDKFFTVAVSVALASLLTGAPFWILGQFKLGNLVRHIPYPVIGGFLAGTGLVLIQGGISVMTGTTVNLGDFSWLVQQDLLIKWIPGFAFALLLMLVLRRYSHFLIIPGMLLSAVAVFYLMLRLTGTSIPAAFSEGWLQSSLSQSSGRLWQPILIWDLQHIEWSALALRQEACLPSSLSVLFLSC